jgi:hypothetical protein
MRQGPSVFVVRRLPSVLLPASPLMLPVVASYAIPIQLSRASFSTVTVIARASFEIGANSTGTCVGVTISPVIVTFAANSIVPSSPITLSVSRDAKCSISWSVVSADVDYDSAVIPDLVIRTVLPLNISSATIFVAQGSTSHVTIACPVHFVPTCIIALDSDVTSVTPSSTISAELRPFPPSYLSAYETDTTWGAGGALLVVSASQFVAAGVGTTLCFRAAAVDNDLKSSLMWTHGVCIDIWSHLTPRIKGGGSCRVGDSVTVFTEFDGNVSFLSRVEYFLAGQQNSGVRIDVNKETVGTVTCLSQGLFFIQACIYPLQHARSAALCSTTPALVECTARSFVRPVSAMLPRTMAASYNGVSAVFSPHSLVVLVGSSASAVLDFNVPAPPPSLTLVATAAHVIVRAVVSSGKDAEGVSISIKVTCLDTGQSGGVQDTSEVRALDMSLGQSGIVLDDMKITCASPVVIEPLPLTPCFSVVVPPFIFSSLSIVPRVHLPDSPVPLSSSQKHSVVCTACDTRIVSSGMTPSASLRLVFINTAMPALSLQLPPPSCPIVARLNPATPPRHIVPFSEPHSLCVLFSVLPPPLLLLSLGTFPPLSNVILSPSRLVSRSGQGRGLCFNLSVVHGGSSEAAQAIGISIQVEGGASSSWGNLSWVIPDVAVIYPAQVVVSSSPILVVGVPSLLNFRFAENANNITLQLQSLPPSSDVGYRHVVVEQKQPATAGHEGLISLMCTFAAQQPPLLSLLFVSVDSADARGNSQRVVSRVNLNVTCVASSITLQPTAASVLLEEAFVVKISVIEAAPPSVFPLICDPGLALESPPPALMPLSGKGFYEGVFVLKCRFVVCCCRAAICFPLLYLKFN